MSHYEFLEFGRPGRNSKKCLNVQNIRSDVTLEDIFNLFRQYGLICNVHLQPSTLKKHKLIGQIYFYSEAAAIRAKLHLHATDLKGNKLKIFSTGCPQKNKGKHFLDDLPWYKAVQLANHYLGFNGWSSSVVEVSESCFVNQQKMGKQAFFSKWTCEVVVQLKDGRKITGKGSGGHVSQDKFEAKKIARKLAVLNSRHCALSRLKFILVDDKCVYIHIGEEEILPSQCWIKGSQEY